jgi:hypothetical protein
MPSQTLKHQDPSFTILQRTNESFHFYTVNLEVASLLAMPIRSLIFCVISYKWALLLCNLDS